MEMLTWLKYRNQKIIPMRFFGEEKSWAELIKTFAAVFAIAGGIAGFYKLFQNDKDVQNQISSLQTIVVRLNLAFQLPCINYDT